MNARPEACPNCGNTSGLFTLFEYGESMATFACRICSRICDWHYLDGLTLRDAAEGKPQ